MNETPDRRTVLAGLAATTSLGIAAPALAKSSPNVVIVGGGFGGASAAMQFRKIAPNIKVTLIEPSSAYTACPFSNLVIGGSRNISLQTFAYSGLKAAGVKLIQDYAKQIDPDTKTVTSRDGISLTYDRLILSPGIDFIWDAIEGFDETAAQNMPHAWKAGLQTELLAQQLQAMEDGGVVAISVPPPPFRCPPGPYERASLIADYLKRHKPRSKLVILDSQDRFSKQPLFEAAWRDLYPGIIERMPGSESGQVIRVESKTRKLFTDFDELSVDVANVIPPQKAGKIAHIAAVANATGWCPVNAVTFESTLAPNVHVIGDATIASPMPKSAFSANLQGKICAAQIARILAGQPPIATTLSNTCYSYAAPDYAFSVSGVYHNDGAAFQSVPGAGGTSPIGAEASLRLAEARQAEDWFKTITREAFG
ncbi:MAG: FAD-dependent oxidoreductase [Hellea sp.]|nr:FAD-dependent oxidoreductase [Hellea sp.]